MSRREPLTSRTNVGRSTVHGEPQPCGAGHGTIDTSSGQLSAIYFVSRDSLVRQLFAHAVKVAFNIVGDGQNNGSSTVHTDAAGHGRTGEVLGRRPSRYQVSNPAAGHKAESSQFLGSGDDLDAISDNISYGLP